VAGRHDQLIALLEYALNTVMLVTSTLQVGNADSAVVARFESCSDDAVEFGVEWLMFAKLASS